MHWNYGILCCWLLLAFAGSTHAGNVLYLGDSHSVKTSLEEAIYQGFHGRGDSFFSEAVCSSKPDDWVDNPRYTFPCWLARHDGKRPDSGMRRLGLPQIYDIVKRSGPAGFDIVVIEQGDNMLGSDKGDIARRSIKLLRAIAGEMREKKVSCYWLGPTWPSNGDEFKDTKTVQNTEKVRAGITEAIELFNSESRHKCRYIDGMKLLDREWTQRQKGDGLHFELGGQAYGQWGQKAFRAMEGELTENSAGKGSNRAETGPSDQ